jgi:hypothetical protein
MVPLGRRAATAVAGAAQTRGAVMSGLGGRRSRAGMLECPLLRRTNLQGQILWPGVCLPWHTTKPRQYGGARVSAVRHGCGVSSLYGSLGGAVEGSKCLPVRGAVEDDRREGGANAGGPPLDCAPWRAENPIERADES